MLSVKPLNNLYLYAKVTDNVQEFEFILREIALHQKFGNVIISTEPRRSYYELDKIKEIMKDDDACVITNLASLGLNEKEIASGLDWFITNSRMLVIANFNTSYSWGIGQPMNKAILQTLQQALLGNVEGRRTVMIPEHRKSNAGRKHINFPDNWEELYDKWKNKEITSKEFCERSGLKKATFYNLLTEYKQVIEMNENYFKRYQRV